MHGNVLEWCVDIFDARVCQFSECQRIHTSTMVLNPLSARRAPILWSNYRKIRHTEKGRPQFHQGEGQAAPLVLRLVEMHELSSEDIRQLRQLLSKLEVENKKRKKRKKR